MAKKDTFKNIIRYEVLKSFKEAYGFNTLHVTRNQEDLVEKISERLYNLFGSSMTVKELKEKINEQSIS